MTDALFQYVNPLASVPITSVTKILDKGPGLLKWANRVGLEGKTLDQARGSGTTDGRAVHRVMEILQAGEAPAHDSYDPSQRAYVRELVRWWDGTHVRALHLEAKAASQTYRFHGRVDLVRACTTPDCHCYGEGGVLIDVKTGTDRPYAEHHLQVAGYRLAWPEGTLSPRHLCGAEVVCLPKRGAYVVHPSDMPSAAFLAALELWRFVDAQKNGRQLDADEVRLVRGLAVC